MLGWHTQCNSEQGKKWFKRCFILCNQLEGPGDPQPAHPPPLAEPPPSWGAYGSDRILHHTSRHQRPSSPSVQLRYYEDSWRPVRPAPSPARPRTAWRWPRRSPRCRCSLPTASHDRLAMTWQTLVSLVKKKRVLQTWKFACRGLIRQTSLAVPAVVAATVVKVSQTAVPG